MEKIQYGVFLHGGDYNPEQWKKYPEILREDMDYFKKANCNTMTMGIFSWSELEPEEGVLNFGFFDTVIDDIAENGGKVVLATPSAAMPRWLREKYPDAIRIGEDGRPIINGRMNFCYSSPDYRKRVEFIDRAIAEHYKDNKAVILYHISNEFCSMCYCKRCRQGFTKYLRKKYKTLDNFNDKMWASFWSGTFTEWEQINPFDVQCHGITLEWKRYTTLKTKEFFDFEVKVLKSVTPDIPVTTNYMSPYDGLDYNRMSDNIDIVSWDSYPRWHTGNDAEIAVRAAFEHDKFRGIKQKPFLVMESAPGTPSTTYPVCRAKKPGLHALQGIQAISHGADSYMYFQWRKGRGGMEKFHGAVIDHDRSTENRVFKDVSEIGEILKKLTPVVCSDKVSAAAVLFDYDNKWSLDVMWGWQNGDKKYEETCIEHYKQFWKRGINCDVICPDREFSPYKIIVAPMLHEISEEMIDKIERYVANGGVFVGTYTLGYVDESNLCYLGGVPGGRLKDIFGLRVEELETACDGEKTEIVFGSKSYDAVDYMDIIKTTTAKSIAVYGSNHYRGKCCAAKNNYKEGTAYYIGARDGGDFLGDIYDLILEDAKISACKIKFPAGMTVQTRGTGEKVYYFVENFNDKECDIILDRTYNDIIAGKQVSGKITLPPFGFIVII